MHSYWQTTRHPWPCLLFVLPLLALYEGSMLYQAMEGVQPYRAGLDAWIYSYLTRIQWNAMFLPSALMGLICITWAVIRWDRSPPEKLSTLAGMFIESIVYALALWGVGALVTTHLANLTIGQRGIQAIALMGSGLFEEILFRLLGFGLIYYFSRLVLQERTAIILAVFVTSFGFSAAHYLGPLGEAWQVQTFVFRSLAGVMFALLFHYRGLGIAVGTHSAYNVIVGLVAY